MSNPFGNNPWGGSPYNANPYSSNPAWNNSNGIGVGSYPANSSNLGMQGGFASNIIKVTSLEEAIMKTPPANADLVYFNQNKDEFYRVSVDQNGNKAWKTFAFYIPEEGETATVTRKDLAPFVSRLEALEAKINPTTAGTEA